MDEKATMDHGFDNEVSSGAWVATCMCGWRGPGQRAARDYVAADATKRDYQEHVEETLGARAYYEAPVGCRNCGSRHTQGVPVGMECDSIPCSQCGTTMLQPDNEVWDDHRAHLFFR